MLYKIAFSYSLHLVPLLLVLAVQERGAMDGHPHPGGKVPRELRRLQQWEWDKREGGSSGVGTAAGPKSGPCFVTHCA